MNRQRTRPIVTVEALPVPTIYHTGIVLFDQTTLTFYIAQLEPTGSGAWQAISSSGGRTALALPPVVIADE